MMWIKSKEQLIYFLFRIKINYYYFVKGINKNTIFEQLKNNIMKKQLIELYLDWVNNFVSLEGFANYYELTTEEANTLIDLGRKFNKRF